MRPLLILLLSLKPALGLAAEPLEPHARRVIVTFKPEATAAERAKAVKSLGINALESVDELDSLIAEVSADRISIQSVEAQAANFSSVLNVEEDFFTNWIKSPEATFQGSQLPNWAEVRTAIPALKPASEDEIPWGVARVNAPAAWPKTQGAGVRVAVIDTGIDASHPDLHGNVAGGYNAVIFGGSDSFMDDNGHGSHVSGTIAAAKDGKGVVGVAPMARLYAVKVLDKNGSGWMTSVARGIVWCARHDIQVANLSLGAPRGSFLVHMALKYAKSKGVAVIAAAGNSSGHVEWPGAYTDVTLAVAASGPDDQIASFSSRGKEVAFIAPGVGIKSTVLGGGYDSWDGTSMATPHVTGLAALAVSRGARGLDGVRDALKKASRPIGLAATEEGSGMVDAALLVK